MSEIYTMPVQHCPLCQASGVRLPRQAWGPSLAFDSECTSCGHRYTSEAHRAVLRALTQRFEDRL